MDMLFNFKVYTNGEKSIASQIAYEKFLVTCALRGYEFSVTKHSIASALTVYHVTVYDVSYEDAEYAVYRLGASIKPVEDIENDEIDTFGEIDADNFHEYFEE